LNCQTFLTVIEQGPESFGAFSPDIPGCIAFTAKREELLPLLKLAIEAHFRELAEAGEPLPVPETTGIPGLTIGVPSAAITLEWTSVNLPTPVNAA
jgi:predicted RNase H-like HicB family nuclease